MSDYRTANEETYLDLVMALEDLQGQMSLLVAVCDDATLRDRLVDRYEAELREQGMLPVRSRLDVEEPSLTDAIRGAIAAEPELETGAEGVVTIVGADELSFVAGPEEQSPQEKFFGYLQWTREALLAFRLPLVLWVSGDLANKLVFRASDFWSWRKAVFHLEWESDPGINFQSIKAYDFSCTVDDLEGQEISLDALKQLISEAEAAAPRSKHLSSLYSHLGEAYRTRLKAGEMLDVPTETCEAFRALNHAINLQTEMGLIKELAHSYRCRGIWHYYRADYQRAVSDYTHSLSLARSCRDRKGEAKSLTELGNIYLKSGNYNYAIECHEKSLEVQKLLEDLEGEAISLGNLGLSYELQGGNEQALSVFLEQYSLSKKIKDRQGEGNSLGNLGIAYSKEGQHEQALEFHEENLKIANEINDLQSKARALGNLGNTYAAMGDYKSTIESHNESLRIRRTLEDLEGEAICLGNLGIAHKAIDKYEHSIKFYEHSIEIAERIEARVLAANQYFNLGNVLVRTDDQKLAKNAYGYAQALYERLGLKDEMTKCVYALERLEWIGDELTSFDERLGKGRKFDILASLHSVFFYRFTRLFRRLFQH